MKNDLEYLDEISDGVAEFHDEASELESLCVGVRRRIPHIKGNPSEAEDTERWVRYMKAAHEETRRDNYGADKYTIDYYDGGWEIHFQRYLDTLSVPQIIEIADRYLQLAEKDPSALHEYRLCMDLIDSLIGLDSKRDTFSYKDENTLVYVHGDQQYYLPIKIFGTDGAVTKLRTRNIFTFLQNQLYASRDQEWRETRQKTVEKIYSSKNIDSAFDCVREYFGYKNNEYRQEFLAAIDVDMVVTAINQVVADEYIPYSFNGEQPRISILMNSRSDGEKNLCESFVATYKDIDVVNKERVSMVLGTMIGKIAARTMAPSSEDFAFLFSSGLLEHSSVREAYERKRQESADKNWAGTDIDPIHDQKVMSVYHFTRQWHNGLDERMRWADYIASPDFQVDMTRGGDPSEEMDGTLSATLERDDARGYDYTPGIYCGVLGAFKDWSMGLGVIIKNMPLRLVDGVSPSGEAVIPARSLKTRLVQSRSVREEKGRIIGGLFVYDASQAQVIPWDNPENVQHKSMWSNNLFISTHVLDEVRRYYPDARIEYKEIRSNMGSKVLESVSLPYLVLPSSARDNLVKIKALKDVTGILNIIIER